MTTPQVEVEMSTQAKNNASYHRDWMNRIAAIVVVNESQVDAF